MVIARAKMTYATFVWFIYREKVVLFFSLFLNKKRKRNDKAKEKVGEL